MNHTHKGEYVTLDLHGQTLRLERDWFTFWIEMALLHASKNKDYGETDVDPYANFRGSAEIGIPEWKGVVQRMMDKWSRIKTFCREGNLTNESFHDSGIDNAVYSLIMLSLFHQDEDKSTVRTDCRYVLTSQPFVEADIPITRSAA